MRHRFKFLAGGALAALALQATAASGFTQDERMKFAYLKMQRDDLGIIDLVEAKGPLEALDEEQLFSLCGAYSDVGRFGRMKACFERQQQLAKDGPLLIPAGTGKADITVPTFVIMTRGYVRIRDCGKALAAAQRAVRSIVTSLGPAVMKVQQVTAYGELGNAYACQGDAARVQDNARRLTEIAGDPADPYFAGVLQNMKQEFLFEMHVTARNYQAALDAYDKWDQLPPPQARQWFASQGKQAELDRWERLLKLTTGVVRASLLVELDRFEGVKAPFDAALADTTFQSSENHWSALYYRGRVAEKEGNEADAIRFYQRAVDAVESQRSSLGGETAKINFVGDKQAVYGYLVGALARTGRAGEAFEYAERGKARALVDLLATRTGTVGTKQAGERQAALLSDMAKAQADLVRFNPERATPQQIEQNRQVRGLFVAAASQLREAAPELASLVTVSSVGEARLRALLQPDETLVEYYALGDSWYGFVGTRSSLRVVRLDGAGLPDLVRRFRASVQNARSRDSAALARELHTRLLAPLNLPPQGKLLVVPHGVLHYLPFGALRDAKGDLVDRYGIRLLPSASVLAFLSERKPSGKGLLVLGNPDLGNAEYDLPGAQKEATEIARLRPDAKLLMRAAATKEALKAEGGKYAWLHFASHGKFNPDQPLQSGLYLAGRDTEGMLAVDELYGLDLDADLVTLSACETALGRVDNGDDVIGLTRGFFYAGASSIVSSLWQVDDEATYLLMTRFYGELARAAKGDALRSAQLAVKARYPHPFYWAAFQLTGNAR